MLAGLLGLGCGGAASAPPRDPTSAPTSWIEAAAAPEPFGCTLAPIWGGHVVWIVPDGPIAAFAAEHQDASAPVPLPPELAARTPSYARVLVPAHDALCVATLGPPSLIPGHVEQTVPSFGRALSGCSEDHAPLALLCPADARVPDALRWTAFSWGPIAAAQSSSDDALVAHAFAQRDALTEPAARAAAAELAGAVEIDRGRSASITVGAEAIGAAQLGLAWFAPGDDPQAGCPSAELTPGAVYAHTDDAWSRVATGDFFVGVLHDAEHVLALVEDGYSRETESCDGEHACFYVALQTLEGRGFVRRARAISELTAGDIPSHSALRFGDTRPACADADP